jgi:hypothetical protein
MASVGCHYESRPHISRTQEPRKHCVLLAKAVPPSMLRRRWAVENQTNPGALCGAFQSCLCSSNNLQCTASYAHETTHFEFSKACYYNRRTYLERLISGFLLKPQNATGLVRT